MPSFGSVQKTGKNSWKLVVSSGFDGAGKRIRHTKTIHTTSDNDEKQEKEARQQLALFISEVEKGNTSSSGKINLSQFCDLWLKNHADRHLAPKTVQRYKQFIYSWILPTMGQIQLVKLKPIQILSFYGKLEEDGIRKDGKEGSLSPRTRLHIHRLLHTILQTAVQWEYLNTNPASKVKAPKAERAKIRILDEEQTVTFILHLDNEDLKWKMLSLLTLAAGLRLSEVMGIEWQHIDLDKQTLSIEQSSHYINRVGIITKSTKNQSSERLISLPKSIIELLKQYRSHQNTERLRLGDKWRDNDRLFTQWDGKPMSPSSFNMWLTGFCSRSELPKITPQSLRHLSATVLLNSGISLKNVSGRLGHARTSTTGDIYAHFLKSTDKVAAEKMDEILSLGKEKKQT
ncbi:tyrosine-type recombinase/integrase [Sporomusa sp.]|uniref:tyrosine-type recombinase/integrase n=1 Tax=Sporomusa sp. TaxID=2078658 RepID=UPI002C3972BA|nr:tyrosine-type recombinase/integrase [Sporomusa sp.]HWR42266.1 tyrosine-type recombinase/integrase [Sporomusa sp.]